MVSADVVIVGSGPVGCLMAAKLCEQGFTVIVLEAGSGSRPIDYPHPQRDVFTSTGAVAYPLNGSRVRAVGGTTNHWGGYTPRLMEGDFRSHTLGGIGTDWPISYADLEPWYTEAERELGVAGNADNAFAAPRSAPYPMPGRGVPPDLRAKFSALGISLHSQPMARTTRAWDGRPPRSLYRAHEVHLPRALATGRCRLITDANVVRLETDTAGRVRRAVYAGLADRVEKAAEGRLFVLGCGGVETARLLLLSASGRFPNGLANGSGMVGRYFMDHHRLDLQCEFAARLCLPFDRVLSSEFYRRTDGTSSPMLLLTLKARPGADDFVRQYYWGSALRERLAREAVTQLLIGATIEAIPHPDNTVDLDPDLKDLFGNPAPRITYSYTPEVEAGFAKARSLLQRIAAELRPELSYLQGPLHLHHQMGTCRMSSDPAAGVVNANLFAHEVPNLVVVGGAVFVTGGCVNPTLTIAALALRAADHIRHHATT